MKEKEEAISRLRELVRPGQTVYTILRSVSRSGMSRRIDCYVLLQSEAGPYPCWISNLVGKALDWPVSDKGVKVAGCGMDMAFHLIYSLSCVLFPDGFDCLGNRCPGNDHFNQVKTSHHKDGGYALRREWI